MVQRKQEAQDFFAGGGADGVADAVILGKGFYFVEVMIEGKVMPAVSVADGEVEFDVKAAQFEQTFVTACGFFSGLFADYCDLRWGEVARVEEVVDARETSQRDSIRDLRCLW